MTAVSGSPFTTTIAPRSMILNSSGGYLYVSGSGSADTSAYALDSITGFPTAIVNSPFVASTAPSFLAIAPSNTFLLEVDETAKSDFYPAHHRRDRRSFGNLNQCDGTGLAPVDFRNQIAEACTLWFASESPDSDCMPSSD